jgi:hypothetical protein
MGRATPILKRTCHVTLVLKESENKKMVSRFNTMSAKKEKEAKKIVKVAAKPKHEVKELEHQEAPTQENKKGFAKKVFRRKSV